MKHINLTIAAMLVIFPALLSAQTRQEMEAFRSSVNDDLTSNILPFWIDKSIDQDGGFYGTVLADNTAVPDSDKGAVLNARILWTFSRAFREYAYEDYRMMADRAAQYFKERFIDKKYGGVYWSLDSDGHPKDSYKQTYATAFGIYGLSEHFRSTGDRGSLDVAIGLYRTLEEKVHDRRADGYTESFQRDYSPSSMKGVDGKEGATKTMNTHIHILEAYTSLYGVWPDEGLKENLVGLIRILQEKLYSPATKHLIPFCDDDWKEIGHVDSYGHDIETSWLLCEAAEATGDSELLRAVQKQAVDMADTALGEGLNGYGFMRYEKNEGVYDDKIAWWPQCEAVIGSINAWQITGDIEYYRKAEKIWELIRRHFIDKEGKGWFKSLTGAYSPSDEPKVSMWNCPYHNSRAAFELSRRLSFPAVHTEVMAWSNITGVRIEGELVDFESSLRIGTIDGKHEITGRERQSGIDYTRKGASQITTTPMHGAVITQTVTDIDMETVKLNWEVNALENLEESVFFCISLDDDSYRDARISTSRKGMSVNAADKNFSITFDKAVKIQTRQETDSKVIYVTLMPKLAKGRQTVNSATLEVSCKPDRQTVCIEFDPEKPGRTFAGFGGNFRIQNVKKDPEVIDYCMEHLQLAFGRVEFPWATWDAEGPDSDHVRRSAEMARRLKAAGMPVIVSCWFPPEWAGIKTTRSDGNSRAYSLKPGEKPAIFASIAGYLLFLKEKYGVEADYFSFNESDLGIDVVFTPEEHRDFIKEFGAYLAEAGLATRMLLGDNSDATTFNFIVPTLDDPSAHKYVGAISFHSWRGCDDATLTKWAEASRRINVPLIVGEGSTDAAAYRYPEIFNETTFALYEINLYTRICALSQPLSILQWQLTSDYSVLWGNGICGSEGPLHPTQRFFNLKQLSMTPPDSFAAPVSVSKDNLNAAAFVKPSTGESAIHIVNNGGRRTAEILGLPKDTEYATVYVTNSSQNAEAALHLISDGKLTLTLPAESFISIIAQSN